MEYLIFLSRIRKKTMQNVEKELNGIMGVFEELLEDVEIER